jgi:N6-adenosine-specific RNA methylase IME4
MKINLNTTGCIYSRLEIPSVAKGHTVKNLREALPEKYGAILIDPPWRFANRTGKMAPEHKRLHRYPTMSFEEIAALPVGEIAAEKSHLYLWCPNALLAEALGIMKAWGFTYKTNIVWYKVRKDGGPDGRGVGFYFRNVTELILFGIKGRIRTLAPGRRQVNVLVSRKEEHSKKPDALYDLIQRCSPGPYCELFSRQRVEGWIQWGDEVDSYKAPPHKAYAWTTNGDRSTPSPPQLEAAGSRQHRLRLLSE